MSVYLKNVSKERGFTLIELIIVLAIIIAQGITTSLGRELLNKSSAEFRFNSNIEQIKTAAHEWMILHGNRFMTVLSQSASTNDDRWDYQTVPTGEYSQTKGQANRTYSNDHPPERSDFKNDYVYNEAIIKFNAWV